MTPKTMSTLELRILLLEIRDELASRSGRTLSDLHSKFSEEFKSCISKGAFPISTITEGGFYYNGTLKAIWTTFTKAMKPDLRNEFTLLFPKNKVGAFRQLILSAKKDDKYLVTYSTDPGHPGPTKLKGSFYYSINLGSTGLTRRKQTDPRFRDKRSNPR